MAIGVLEGAMYIGSFWLLSPNIDDVDIRAFQETLRVEEGFQASMTRLEGNAIHCRWLGRGSMVIARRNETNLYVIGRNGMKVDLLLRGSAFLY